MADRKQYVLTRKVMGMKPMSPGHVVELTDKQAKSPIYRNRVRLHDSHLTPAVVKAEPPLEFGLQDPAPVIDVPGAQDPQPVQDAPAGEGDKEPQAPAAGGRKK